MARRRPPFSAALSALAGILILASGCVEQTPTTTQLEAPTALSAAKAYARGSYTASIGTSGGTLEFPIGTISFPAGAVPTETRITATVDGKSLAVDFQPHLVFPAGARPTLTLSFAGVRAAPATLVVFHISDSGKLLEVLRPTVDLATSTLKISASSFSGFVIGSGKSNND